jgi:hypothetical protein
VRTEIKDMRIQFNVGDTSVEFQRNWFTGRAEFVLNGRTITLQDPQDFGTHFSFALKRVWKYRLDRYEIVIEKVRPLLLAGIRPHTYRVIVDGKVLEEKKGY